MNKCLSLWLFCGLWNVKGMFGNLFAKRQMYYGRDVCNKTRRNLAVCVCVWLCVHAERPLTNLKCSRNQFFMLPWTWPLFTWETGRGRRNGQQKNLNWFYYFTLKLEWLIGALSNSEVSFISWQKHLFFLKTHGGPQRVGRREYAHVWSHIE